MYEGQTRDPLVVPRTRTEERLGREDIGIQQALRYCGAEPVRQFLMREFEILKFNESK